MNMKHVFPAEHLPECISLGLTVIYRDCEYHIMDVSLTMTLGRI